MADAAEIGTPDALEPEEEARALWYAVVSRLFYAAPDRELLAGLSSRLEDGPDNAAGPFPEAWRALQLACRDADPAALREEYETLFVGVGKAPVTPYTSSYAAPHAPDQHLVRLRSSLNDRGLSRRERVFEAEDHVAALCDAMRWLIVQGRPLEEQRAFFDEFVDAGVALFCNAINQSPSAAFYCTAGAFARAFVAVEKEAFDMHTPA